MNNKHIIKPRYELASYDGHEVEIRSISWQECQEINPESHDHFMSQSQGIWGYRNKQGQWIEHRIKWPGLGNTCIKIIQSVQLNPGAFLSPRNIAELCGIASLAENNNLSSRWLAIRKAHGESFKKTPRFFLSRRPGGMGVSWNPVRTWLSIERIPTVNPQREMS